MEAYGQSHPLFVIKGSCHGVEISLDINHVPFGAVVKSSRSTRRILLMNTGDIGAKYVERPIGCMVQLLFTTVN